MLNTNEYMACDPTEGKHLEGLCEDCEVRRLAGLPLGEVNARYQEGRFSQAALEAYMYVWSHLSPHGGGAGWRVVPVDTQARRMARKLIRLGGWRIPLELEGAA